MQSLSRNDEAEARYPKLREIRERSELEFDVFTQLQKAYNAQEPKTITDEDLNKPFCVVINSTTFDIESCLSEIAAYIVYKKGKFISLVHGQRDNGEYSCIAECEPK